MLLGLVVDGDEVEVGDVPAWWSLARLLRDGLGRTATKIACGEGGCGACAVEVDGAVVHSCLYPAHKAAGGVVRTAVSLAGSELVAELERRGAPQCGFCFPGMVVAAAELYGAGSDRADVAAALAGNLCRCTGYHRILDALTAAESSS